MPAKPRTRQRDESSMFWFVRIFVMLALAATLVIGLGFLLPEERTSVKTTLIDAPPERVYQIVTDVEKQTLWRSDIKSLHVERRGDLWAWTEEQQSGTTLTVEELVKEPLKRYEYKFKSSGGQRGLWIGEFEASNEGRTKLTFTETITIENPLRRVAAYILLNLDTLMDVYLGDLNRYASQPESTVDPLLRTSLPPLPKPTPTPVVEPTATATPSPTPSPTASAPATVAPLSTVPSPATPSVDPVPSPGVSSPPTPSPTAAPSPTAPPLPVPTSTSITLPSPGSSLPPNTPSLLTPPSATPSATATRSTP